MRFFNPRNGQTYETTRPTPSKEFEIGDAVVLLKDYENPNGGRYETIRKGSKGVVVHLANTGSVGVEWRDYHGGHDCLRHCSSYDTGLWVKPFAIKKVPKSIEDEFAELARMCDK